MAAEEGEYGQNDADAQRPIAKRSPENLYAERRICRVQLNGLAISVAVAKAWRLRDHLTGLALDYFKAVEAGGLNSEAVCHAGLLVKLSLGLAYKFAQPFKNGAALRDRCGHGRSSTWVTGIR